MMYEETPVVKEKRGEPLKQMIGSFCENCPFASDASVVVQLEPEDAFALKARWSWRSEQTSAGNATRRHFTETEIVSGGSATATAVGSPQAMIRKEQAVDISNDLWTATAESFLVR